ncbi:hypothetical protein FKP32DRAFT_1659199 [Trametes sanguinea]|nr:hypothetical protein FKP32DRAFT_1659199 [Trametes sanguinea]
MDPSGDPDVMRVWALVSELSEQLSQNRSTSVNLHALTDGVKAQAIHSQTGFALRRFNLDKPKEVYEAELERMNATMSAENQTLLNDNRQLSTLIREYEQTLEKTMEKFRIHAHEVQQRELALMRQYESVIIERETEALQATLTENNARSESLVRISRLLRAVLRKLGGEDIQAYEAYLQAQIRAAKSPASSTSRVAVAEWSLEREIELARLQRENEELRALLNGLLKPNTPSTAPNTTSSPNPNVPAPAAQEHTNGPPGTVGPFGTYKAISTSRYG